MNLRDMLKAATLDALLAALVAGLVVFAHYGLAHPSPKPCAPVTHTPGPLWPGCDHPDHVARWQGSAVVVCACQR